MIDGFKKEYETFTKTGVVGRYSASQRKRNNLPIQPPEVDDIIQLLKEVEEREKEKKRIKT